MALTFDKFNADVKNWGVQAGQSIQREGKAEGIQHRGNSPSPSDSLSKIRVSYGMNTGVVSRISFKFPRTLIYTMKGAGKGMGGTKGSRWIDKHGTSQQTNQRSLGKQDSGGRKAKPFLNSALKKPDGVEQLADIAAEQLSTIVVNNILVK